VKAVDGYRNYPSTEAPFQKFRWIHFPYNPTLSHRSCDDGVQAPWERNNVLKITATRFISRTELL
jgi:hypothetical protein